MAMRQIDPAEAANLLARLVTEWERTTGYLAAVDGDFIDVARRTGNGPQPTGTYVLPAEGEDAEGWAVHE